MGKTLSARIKNGLINGASLKKMSGHRLRRPRLKRETQKATENLAAQLKRHIEADSHISAVAYIHSLPEVQAIQQSLLKELVEAGRKPH